jgi:hypothetical protein
MNLSTITNFWMSGCRLFFLDPTDSNPIARIKVCDFSPWARSKYLSEQVGEDVCGARHLSPTEAEGQIMWDLSQLVGTCSGHDSVVFRRVSAPVIKSPSSEIRLTGALHTAVQWISNTGSESRWKFTIWTF